MPADNTEPAAPRLVQSRRAFEGRLINLRVDTVATADGRISTREVVEHPGAVLLLALDNEDNVILVRQYRQPVGRAMLELPAGTLDEGEDPEACAQRELREETGFRSGRLQRLGGMFMTPGYCSEYIHLFLATDLEESPLDTGDEEDIRMLRLPLTEALRMVESGDMQDAKSIAALLLLARHRGMS